MGSVVLLCHPITHIFSIVQPLGICTCVHALCMCVCTWRYRSPVGIGLRRCYGEQTSRLM